MYQDYSLETSFGDFVVSIPEDSKDPHATAIEEMTNQLNSANCRQSYPDENGTIQSIDVGFYYGHSVVDIEYDTNSESIALDIATDKLIKELQEQ